MAITEHSFLNVPGGVVEGVPHPLLSKLEMERGTSCYWRHGQFRKLLYTDGIKLLATEGKCYWLLDIMGSVFGKLKKYEKMLVRIRVKERKGVVTITDGYTNEQVYTQRIPYTDFPFSDFQFRMDQIPFADVGASEDSIHHLCFLLTED